MCNLQQSLELAQNLTSRLQGQSLVSFFCRPKPSMKKNRRLLVSIPPYFTIAMRRARPPSRGADAGILCWYHGTYTLYHTSTSQRGVRRARACRQSPRRPGSAPAKHRGAARRRPVTRRQRSKYLAPQNAPISRPRRAPPPPAPAHEPFNQNRMGQQRRRNRRPGSRLRVVRCAGPVARDGRF